MEKADKINTIKEIIGDSSVSDSLLTHYLNRAEDAILGKIYEMQPLGVPEDATVPAKYESLGIDIAVYLYNKRGAEGQTAHSENGINRIYEAADIPASMLKKVITKVGVGA